MGKKYIIELEEAPFVQHFENGIGETVYRVKGFNSLVFDWNGLQMLTPYTEDSAYAHGYTEAESKYREIRDELEKQAHQRGYEEAYDTAYADAEEIYGSGKRAMYQKGLKDAWDAARTLWNTPNRKEIFGHTAFNTVLTTLTAQETIEKIRQYEQEKDRQARIEYNFDEIKDVLETTAKECNVSLDEIAAVLQKMKETDNG